MVVNTEPNYVNKYEICETKEPRVYIILEAVIIR